MLGTHYDAVLQVLTYVVPFLGILMAIVFVHELGHFLAGRWCGIEVKTFSLGFGRVLWSFHDSHGTRWQLAAIPLGGYVKFAEDSNAASVATGEQPSPGSAGGAFHNSALWKRVVVVAGLGFFNLLPIPVLDGGHLAFYALEAIRRRPLSARVHAFGYRLGFAFIIGLMVYINMSDLLRLGRRLM